MFENQRNNVSKHQQLYLQTHTFPYIQVRCYYLHDHHFYIRRHFIRCISLQLSINDALNEQVYFEMLYTLTAIHAYFLDV